MKDAFYTFIEINGTSSTSIGDAINWAIKRAHETLRNLRWFEVMETRGKIKPGKWSNGRPRSRWGFP
jgi:flavin-binding protein dodecin